MSITELQGIWPMTMTYANASIRDHAHPSLDVQSISPCDEIRSFFIDELVPCCMALVQARISTRTPARELLPSGGTVTCSLFFSLWNLELIAMHVVPGVLAIAFVREPYNSSSTIRMSSEESSDDSARSLRSLFVQSSCKAMETFLASATYSVDSMRVGFPSTCRLLR